MCIIENNCLNIMQIMYIAQIVQYNILNNIKTFDLCSYIPLNIHKLLSTSRNS